MTRPSSNLLRQITITNDIHVVEFCGLRSVTNVIYVERSESPCRSCITR
jgi:hypothetical protein